MSHYWFISQQNIENFDQELYCTSFKGYWRYKLDILLIIWYYYSVLITNNIIQWCHFWTIHVCGFTWQCKQYSGYFLLPFISLLLLCHLSYVVLFKILPSNCVLHNPYNNKYIVCHYHKLVTNNSKKTLINELDIRQIFKGPFLSFCWSLFPLVMQWNINLTIYNKIYNTI